MRARPAENGPLRRPEASHEKSNAVSPPVRAPRCVPQVAPPWNRGAAHKFFHDTFFDQDVFQDEVNGTDESNLSVFGQAPAEDNSKVLPCPNYCTPKPALSPLWKLGAVFLCAVCAGGSYLCAGGNPFDHLRDNVFGQSPDQGSLPASTPAGVSPQPHAPSYGVRPARLEADQAKIASMTGQGGDATRCGRHAAVNLARAPSNA